MFGQVTRTNLAGLLLVARKYGHIIYEYILMPIYRHKDENFFKKWSVEMAYVLGYFAADGNMIRNQRGAHYIEFTSVDRELIENVRALLNSNHRIGERKEKKPAHKQVYRIQIGSKALFSSLIKLGFTPNKSNSIAMPDVPMKYFQHFMRGYFDGDGCVNYCKYKRKDRNDKIYGVLQVQFVSGSKKFLDSLKKYLADYAKLKHGTRYFNYGHRLAYSKIDSIRLFHFMYKNIRPGLFLRRKFIYFQNSLRKIDC